MAYEEQSRTELTIPQEYDQYARELMKDRASIGTLKAAYGLLLLRGLEELKGSRLDPQMLESLVVKDFAETNSTPQRENDGEPATIEEEGQLRRIAGSRPKA